MKSWERPVATHLDIIDRIVNLSDLDPGEKAILKAELRRYMNNILDHGRWMDPLITDFHTRWYREIYQVAGVADPFTTIKRRSNEHAARIIADLEIPDLERAIVASVVANLLDFGAFDGDRMTVDPEDFARLESDEFLVSDIPDLIGRLARCRSLLYLVDNSGEVLFDRIVVDKVLELNPGCRISVAGKASPMLNDVTADELGEAGFDPRCRLISTGSNCFGVPRSEVSREFQDRYREADLVIAKGHAYLEFWIEHATDKVFNVLYTKFPVQDPVLGTIPAMTRMVIHSARYAANKPGY